jgi:hypothetical protein
VPSKQKAVRLKIEIHEQTEQLNNQASINLEQVYRSLLKIVARLQGSEYTEDVLRQTAEVELDDLADPASANDTSQG